MLTILLPKATKPGELQVVNTTVMAVQMVEVMAAVMLTGKVQETVNKPAFLLVWLSYKFKGAYIV